MPEETHNETGTPASGPAKPPGPPGPPSGLATATPPEPEDRALKSGQVKVRVVNHSLFEGGKRYTKGEVFVTTSKRAAGLKGFVEPVA